MNRALPSGGAILPAIHSGSQPRRPTERARQLLTRVIDVHSEFAGGDLCVLVRETGRAHPDVARILGNIARYPEHLQQLVGR